MLPITKAERQLEKEKLKKMHSLEERIFYIWSYYHIEILITIGIILVFSWIASLFYHKTLDTMLYVVTINQPTLTENTLKPIEEEFIAIQGFNKKKQILSLNTGMNYKDFSSATASEIMLQTFVATQTLDILIANEDFINNYSDKNFFCDLSTVLDEKLIDELSDYFVYTSTSSKKIPIGIFLDKSVLAQKVSLQEGTVLSICSMEKNADTVTAFINYCFQINE